MKTGKGLPEDVEEFGDRTVAGAPSIAELVLALPEERRESYRDERHLQDRPRCAAAAGLGGEGAGGRLEAPARVEAVAPAAPYGG
jgi:hypothetical protein